MRVILKKDVPNLGRAGDIKTVKDGFARNYLMPKNLVMTADAKSQKQQEFLKKVQERKIMKRKKTAEESSTALNGKEFTIKMLVGEEGKLFGSVTNIQIQKEMEKAGYTVDKKWILLDDPIRGVGVYDVQVRFYEGVICSVKINVVGEQKNPSEALTSLAENSETK